MEKSSQVVCYREYGLYTIYIHNARDEQGAVSLEIVLSNETALDSEIM